MRTIAAALAGLLLVAACGDKSDGGADGADPAELMALALHQLVTVDTTFGPGHRFATVLLLTSTDPSAGTARPEGEARPLTEAERAVIEEQVAEVSEVQWVDDPSEWQRNGVPTIENSAFAGVGEVTFDAEGALVPVSLWCGSLCGTWFTYRIQLVDGEWAVTGTEGPVAIS